MTTRKRNATAAVLIGAALRLSLFADRYNVTTIVPYSQFQRACPACRGSLLKGKLRVTLNVSPECRDSTTGTTEIAPGPPSWVKLGLHANAKEQSNESRLQLTARLAHPASAGASRSYR